MYVTRFLTAAAAVALLSAPAMAQDATTPAPATSAPAAAAPAATPAASADLVETARAAGNFTTLLKALDAANLTSVLKTNQGLTVFAPTDAAFAALPAGELDKLMADPAKLQKVLAYHVINLPLPSSKLQGAKDDVPSVAGPTETLAIDGTGSAITVNGVAIAKADIAATNGTIHVIDKVLIPGAAPATTAAAPAAAGEPADASATEADADATDDTGATTDKAAEPATATPPVNPAADTPAAADSGSDSSATEAAPAADPAVSADEPATDPAEAAVEPSADAPAATEE